MTDQKPKENNSADPYQKLKNCGGGLLESLGRLLLTVISVIVFGALVFFFLNIEIGLMGSLGILPDTSPLVKGLILTGLLFLVLLFMFWSSEKVHGYLQNRRGKSSEPLFDRIAGALDDWFRNLDWSVNRGRWDDKPRWQFMRFPEHPSRPTILAILMAVFLAIGPRIPSGSESIASYILCLFAIVLIVMANLWLGPKLLRSPYTWLTPTRLQLLLQILVLGILSLAIFFFPEADTQRVVDPGPYRHFLIPAFWVIGVATLAAGLLAFLLFRKYAGRIDPKTGDSNTCPNGPVLPLELPGHRKALGIDWKRFGRSLVKAPIYHFIDILWWPSLAIVFIADPETMGRVAFFLAVAAWAIYALGEMHEELDNFLGNLKRALFMGGQLVVSIAVVGLAAGRLLDNSYVRTLIEGEGLFGWMNNWVLLYYLASAYTLFWYFEYWINRFLAEQLLAMFENRGESQGHAGPISMPYHEGEETKQGVLVVHEAARYALIGDKGPVGDEGCVKRILGRVKLVHESIKDGCEIDLSARDRNDERYYLAGREFKLVLVHRLRFYFTIIYLALAVFAGWYGYALYTLPQRAELVAQLPESTNEGLFNLRRHLFSQEIRQQRPAILLAASGGGTRAAVYTYSVFSGLHDLGVLKDVVLASGVSGGSAAIAYFAMHREELLGAERGRKKPAPEAAKCEKKSNQCRNWERYGAVMTAPFIQDALRGLSEWRMTWGCPGMDDVPQEGMRLGVLLQESFDRWFALHGTRELVYSDACSNPRKWSGPVPQVARLGDQKRVGLIFNTALAGSSESKRIDCPNAADCAKLGLTEAEPLALENGQRDRTTTVGKGGRLVLTNLRVSRNSPLGSQGPFPDEADALKAAPGDFLTYEVINDPGIPLASAAALSANFPPVFPNAAVDVSDRMKNKSRYWVTDGGATDNRGIISLLYALEGAIREELKCSKRDADQRKTEHAESSSTETVERQVNSCQPLSDPVYLPIHIVLAEASATDPNYQQDRGITTTYGAAERFASQLLVDKLKQIRTLYAELQGQGIHLHKLAMPLTLRSAGGIGTHWMLPQRVTLRKPAGLQDQCEKNTPNTDNCWPAPPTPVERFRRITAPGVNIKGIEAKGLVEALHRFPWSKNTLSEVCVSDGDQSDPDRCRDIEELWQRWICKDPQDIPHAKSWHCLVDGIGRANGSKVKKTYGAESCEIPDLASCADFHDTQQEKHCPSRAQNDEMQYRHGH